MSSLTCNHCSTIFSTKITLKRHIDRVEYKNIKKEIPIIRTQLAQRDQHIVELENREKIYIDRINTLTKELENREKIYLDRIDALTKELENREKIYLDKINILTKESENRERINLDKINRLTEELFQKQLYIQKIETIAEKSETRADKLEDHILKENSKPRNNITVNLAPWDLTPERVEEICKEYTPQHFMDGPEATYKFLLEKHLKDDQGNLKLRCTDVARRIFKGKEPDGSEFVDVGAARVKQEIVRPLKKAVSGTIRQLDDVDTDTLVNKRTAHMRILEPARLSKRLAGDLKK